MIDFNIGDLVIGSSNNPFWQRAGHCNNLKDLQKFADSLGSHAIVDVGKVIGIRPELKIDIWATREYGQWKNK